MAYYEVAIQHVNHYDMGKPAYETGEESFEELPNRSRSSQIKFTLDVVWFLCLEVFQPS